MKSNESQILESVRSYFGLDPTTYDKVNKLDLGSQHIQNHIRELFKIEVLDLNYYEPIYTAFAKVSTTTTIDDPYFQFTFSKEMASRGIPQEEINKALESADSILDKLHKESEPTSIKDGGTKENLDDIKKVSQPEIDTEFESIKPRKGHTQKQNVDSDMPTDRD